MIFVLRIVGLWPSENDSFIYKAHGYVMFGIFSVLLTLAMCLQMVAIGFVQRKSLTDSMFMALTEIALIVKIVNFHLRIRAMQVMMKQLKSFQIETNAERNEFSKKLNFLVFIWIIYIMGANTACGSAYLKVYTSPEKILPFPAFYGFDHSSGGINYWIVYAHQVIGMTITSNLNVAIEMFPNILMYMCSIEMDILGMRLSSLGYNLNENDGENSTEERNVASLNQKNKQGQTLDRLKRCIRLHKQIHSLSISITISRLRF